MRTITRFNQGPHPAPQTTILTPMRHLMIQMTSDRYRIARIGSTDARVHPLRNPFPPSQRRWKSHRWKSHRQKFCSLLRLPRKIRSRNLLRNRLCLNLIGLLGHGSNCWCYCRSILNLGNGAVNVHYCVNSPPFGEELTRSERKRLLFNLLIPHVTLPNT